MTAYQGRREFRPGSGAIIATALTELVFAAGAVMTYRLHGWYWVSIVLTGGSVLALAGVIDQQLEQPVPGHWYSTPGVPSVKNRSSSITGWNQKGNP